MGFDEDTSASIEWSYTHDQVAEVLNQVADEILTAVEAGHSGLRDALNLMVNAVGHYLDNPSGATLADVADSEYGAPLDVILGWIKQCV